MATTYTVEFTIDDTAPSSGYKLLVASADSWGNADGSFVNYDATNVTNRTYNTTLFFKQGDTIRVKHIHPLGLNIGFTGSHVSAHPDPDVEGTQVSGYEWRGITWSGDFTDDASPPNTTDSEDDFETYWYFFAYDAAGAFAYSQKLRFNKIKGTITAGQTSVAPGSPITFYVNDLEGLLSATGTTWDNRLWINIKNSSGLLMGAALYRGGNGFSVGSWNQGSAFLGSIKVGSTSTTFTTLSTLPAGSYTANLCHYNSANSTEEGNRFWGVENQLSSVGFTATTTANPNPDAFTFDNLPASGSTLALNTEYESSIETLEGMTTSSTVTAMSQESGTLYYKIGSGSWRNTPGEAVPAGSTIRLKNTSSSSNDTVVTSTVTVGTTTSSDWTLTTPVAANPNPDPFSFTDKTDEPINAVITSAARGLAGMTESSTVDNLTNGVYYSTRADFGSSWSAFTDQTGGTIATNAEIRLQFPATSSYNLTRQGAIKIGDTTSSPVWTTKTILDPSTVDYGVQLFNSRTPPQNIFDTRTDRTTVCIASSSITLTIPSSAPYIVYSGDIDCIGMTQANTSQVSVFYTGDWPPPQVGYAGTITTIRGTGALEGTFKIKFTGYSTLAGNSYIINYIAVRY